MEKVIELDDDGEAARVFGIHDRNIKLMREHLGVRITARGHTVVLQGDDEKVTRVATLLERMSASVRDGSASPDRIVDEAVQTLDTPKREEPREREKDGGRLDIIARSAGQTRYLEAITRAPIVFSIGPAGTGKTFLAVRMAVDALRAGSVNKLVLCRPAVEAGEKLGFLPGDFQAKVNPYLRPLYDALNELLEYDQIRRYTDREIIEIVPLAYMRGRTLNRSFIILDEAQNTTRAQMKMFLTRMGQDSKIVVTGDITQVDLPTGQPSGLLHARRILQGIRGVEWVELGHEDIVRHPLVSKILTAYDSGDGGGGAGKRPSRRPDRASRDES